MSKRARECVECRAPFTGEPWQKLCWRCWREQQDAEKREDAYDAGYTDGLIAGIKRGGLDRELLTAAIQLTHPDRHPGRQDLANRTTAALLNLREGLAA